MINLKNRALLFLYIFITSCQSSKVFEIKTDIPNELNYIQIDSNRIFQECYFLNASAENNWRHQYVLHILTDKNEVIKIMHPTNQDKSTCIEQLRKIEKITKNSLKLKICARDILKTSTYNITNIELIDFGRLGKYNSTYHSLTLDTICNEKNKCFSISSTWSYTCSELK